MRNLTKNYLDIAKPWMILGNMVSAAGGFFVASKGRIDFAVLLSMLVGTSLVVASGCVFNNYIDRDMDRKMIRTRNRPLVKGSISPKAALLYAALLGVSGMVLLRAKTNLLCTAMVLTGFVIYVGVYSLYLKRNSVHGTLFGSLAGAAPPLAGYLAVADHFDTGALVLLSIFILWQIPHCYAIAIYRFDDYADAEIPVFPVKHGVSAAKKHIFGHVMAFVAAASMMTFCGYTGYGYLAVVAALGLIWLRLAWSGFGTPDNRVWAGKLYAFSILNIIALCVMMSIDFT
jgi:protoheme IX farnesyltransferase